MFLKRWDGDLLAMDDTFSRLFSEPRYLPPADVREESGEFIVSVDLPGITPEQVDVSIEDSVLVVKGERKYEQERKEEGAYRLERVYGSFERAFRLPGTVDANQVKATYKDGVLEVRVQKSEEAKPKKIAVQLA